MTSLDFTKGDGLIPAIVQDANTHKVLMLGYMNEEALSVTREKGLVTFYSRSKKRLWTKGETSGNHLQLVDIKSDCDSDTLLVKAIPTGPVCHLGNDTCFNEHNTHDAAFLFELIDIISDRKENPTEESYTARLFRKGPKKIAQKVGEEAVEVVIEAIDENHELLLEESADLIYHYLVLLASKNIDFQEVLQVLKLRHKK